MRFEVKAVEPARGLDVPLDSGGRWGLEWFLRDVAEIVQDNSPFDPDLPSLFDPVALGPEAARDIERVLNDSARLLETWGFSAPFLRPIVDTPDGDRAFRGYLVHSLGDKAGEFDSCSSRVILLDANEMLDISQLTDCGAQTLAHERFTRCRKRRPSSSVRPPVRSGPGSPRALRKRSVWE
ncbi:hypothetical protein [Oceanibium sediminis]|uniref:hypothetical protein n=1 Tax=Oceanibium sediminis TaxID=2026339 RepID=UPI000DD4C7EA|nr:hypothetical protein [Oceanibium sediminis]